MLVIPTFFPINPGIRVCFLFNRQNVYCYTLISTSTPLGNSKRIKASTVFEEEL